MNNTLAGQLFSTLTPVERQRLSKFLASPYFNQRSDVQQLHQLLLAATDLNDLDKAAIFAAVYPDAGAFDRAAFNHLLTFYAERVEEFLAQEALRSDPFQGELLRCRAFRQRGLYAHFDTNARALTQWHQQAPARNARWWLDAYQLHHEVVARQLLHRRQVPANLPAAVEALTQFFLLENVRWSATAQALNALSPEAPLEVPLSAVVRDEASAVPETLNPALATLLAGWQALREPDHEPHFLRLKALLDAHLPCFAPHEARDLLMAGINFAIRRHNRGDRLYTREAFDLYRRALDSGVLLENGQLPAYTYVNILNLAQLLGEDAWAQHFLQAGKHLLQPAEREQIHRYALAGYHFRRSAYNEVLSLLQTIDFQEVFMNLDARKMLLRSYYALGEWSALESLIGSFVAYLKRQKGLGYHRESYLNLVKFTKKLLRCRLAPPAKRRNLARQIRSAQAVAERDWLLSQLGD